MLDFVVGMSLLGLVLYFLPFAIAQHRGAANVGNFFFLNLIAGWTVMVLVALFGVYLHDAQAAGSPLLHLRRLSRQHGLIHRLQGFRFPGGEPQSHQVLPRFDLLPGKWRDSHATRPGRRQIPPGEIQRPPGLRNVRQLEIRRRPAGGLFDRLQVLRQGAAVRLACTEPCLARDALRQAVTELLIKFSRSLSAASICCRSQRISGLP